MVKIFFNLVFLLILTGNIAKAAATIKHDGVVFGDWVVSCQNILDDLDISEKANSSEKKSKMKAKVKKDTLSNDTTEKCFLTQKLHITNNKKNNIEAEDKIVFLYIAYNGKDRPLRMVQFLPLPLNVEVGSAIISSGEFLSLSKYSICNKEVCQAVNDITEKELSIILSSENNNLTFMNDLEEQINILISINGLKEGIEFLKSINEK